MIGFASLRMRSSYVLFLAILMGCSRASPDNTLFTLLDRDRTGVYFSNTLVPEDDFNIIDYLYYYDGGGVAIGDINNDRLPDIFLTGNQVSDRLYVNRGDFQFEDITASAGVGSGENTWSTGVSMADVNGDGWLDIYVCRVNHLGKTGHNLLYINQQDGTFQEESRRYGLNFEGLSTHTAWLDYDRDGDLDLYLLNHAIHSRESHVPSWRRIIDVPRFGDKFYRQDDGYFVRIAAEAGIYSSALGYGLGIVASDLNMDGWPDLYVGNDFHEDDYLYLNSGNGTFVESLWETTGQTSRSTMGVDVADLNNDGLPDIVALDMLPPNLATQRTSGGADADVIARIKADLGYGPQTPRNTLQLHRGVTPDGRPFFSEIAPFAGIEATDWSWSPLLADFDGDGWKDLYVTNGIPGRPNDLDYIEYVSTPDVQRILNAGTPEQEAEVAQRMPAAVVPNYAFRGDSTLHFEDVGSGWGLAERVIGNGAAYGDLDLDGDLDLVVNALNTNVRIYRNESTSGYISVELRGAGKNTSAFGAKVSVWAAELYGMQEQFPSRGFQSSVDHVLSFGIGDKPAADSVVVIWPSGLRTGVGPVAAGTRLILNEADGTAASLQKKSYADIGVKPVDDHGISFEHQEDETRDFEILPLLPYWRSARGPALAVADVNGDNLEDVYLGGARDQPGALYLQSQEGRFRQVPFPDSHETHEDTYAIFLDADGDGDQDLYVASGGWIGPEALHQDRLYMNMGDAGFLADPGRLPAIYSNGTTVAAADFDDDGDIDLFVGSDTSPETYGEPGRSSLLQNDGTGHFVDVTAQWSPALQHAGHVTSAVWTNLLGSPLPDLVLAGEWMPIMVFENLGTTLVNRTDDLELSETVGLWQSIVVRDVDGDGFKDLVAGNLGLNTVLSLPLAMFVDDFDRDGRTDPIVAQWQDKQWYAWPPRDALLSQMPGLAPIIPTYNAYSSLSMADLFGNSIEPDYVIQSLASAVYWNMADTSFSARILPDELQWAPVLASTSVPLDKQGTDVWFFAGNLSGAGDALGALNAGWGSVVYFTEEREMAAILGTGFRVPGDARGIRVLQGNPLRIIVARSNDVPMLFEVAPRLDE